MTGGEDVNNRAIVGEGSTCIADGRSTNSCNLSNTGGGGSGSINVGVTGGNSNVNSIVVGLIVHKIISLVQL